MELNFLSERQGVFPECVMSILKFTRGKWKMWIPFILLLYVCIDKCDSLWLCYMALRVPSLCCIANKGDHLL